MNDFIIKLDVNTFFYYVNCFVISIQAGLKCGEIYYTFEDKQSVIIAMSFMILVHIILFIVNLIFFKILPNKNRRKT